MDSNNQKVYQKPPFVYHNSTISKGIFFFKFKSCALKFSFVSFFVFISYYKLSIPFTALDKYVEDSISGINGENKQDEIETVFRIREDNQEPSYVRVGNAAESSGKIDQQNYSKSSNQYIDASVRSLVATSLLASNKNNQQSQPQLKHAIDSLKDVSQIYVNTLERKNDGNKQETTAIDTQNRNGNDGALYKLNLQTFVQPVNRLSSNETDLKENFKQQKDNNNTPQPVLRQAQQAQQPIYENVEIHNAPIVQNRGTLDRGRANIPLAPSSTQEYDDDFDDEDETETASNSYGIGHLVKSSEQNKQFGKFFFF